MKNFAPILLVIGAIAVAALMSALKPEPVKAEVPEAALAVKTQTLNRTEVTLAVESQGTVRPRTRTTLISEVSGTVLEVSEQFIVGGTFKAGEILMRLDPTDHEVDLQRAKAQLISKNALLEFEKARAVQAKKEWEMTGRPESDAPILALRKPYLAEAEANILQAQAQVKQAQLKLQRATIRAPYAGMVSVKSVDVGQYVTTGSRLGETFAIDFVEVRLPLTEKDLSQMDPISFQNNNDVKGVVLSGSVNGNPANWSAVIVRSEGVVNELNRSQYVVARISDPYRLNQTLTARKPPLLVGTFVTAKLKGKTLSDVFKVPRSALLQGSKVAVVDDMQRLRINSVNVVFSDEGYYYVSEGLKEGAEVIVSAVGTPIEGLKLKVKNSSNNGSAE
ncbi:MAG: efflux RND transporter periplasmic adaptor subunit [Porticoccaceae bacterium]|jgi:RND family efflux transporter MFP subunit|nr:efflux RND transporter periplasmic adaptor subunit [Porticoccaceae bacterium]MBT3798766.1 efflux RND transporter periplasmic adaptor subunit [Porticoccaceae bacterium]MBT4164191.1 efflux RND transporter periplasmic adaptor subunit [Porticoccaceae bacterium]MBT4210258.1 efflux RND transporter periplasmic adaptor subunit [Porticoccaceae bacterium]MBT4591049.1 efflux RND transporter periplasmic adaptor subunit [Porticoccaceae bacterium]